MRKQWIPRGHALLMGAFALLTQAAAAQAAPVVDLHDAHARGVSALSASAMSRDDGYVVRTRVSRSLMSRVLAPVALKIVVRDADGAVKAEQQRALGPADLPRRRTRSFYFETGVEVAPAAGDTIEVSLAS